MKKTVHLKNPRVANLMTGPVSGRSGKIYGQHVQGRFSMPYSDYLPASEDLCAGTGIAAGRWVVVDIINDELDDVLAEIRARVESLEDRIQIQQPEQ